LRRDVERLFWQEVARGRNSEEAAVAVGASQAAGSRWFRERGGMPTFMLAPLSGRYLCFEEREEIALLRAQGTGVRDIARRLGRSPSTISRELRRNAATRGGKLDYRASVAQWKAELMARRPKIAKLAGARDRCRAGSTGVAARWCSRWSRAATGSAGRRSRPGDRSRSSASRAGTSRRPGPRSASGAAARAACRSRRRSRRGPVGRHARSSADRASFAADARRAAGDAAAS
jgi:hypothetical protein